MKTMFERIQALPPRLGWLMRSMREGETMLSEQYDEGARVFVHFTRSESPGVLAESYRGYGKTMKSAWDDAVRHMEETQP